MQTKSNLCSGRISVRISAMISLTSSKDSSDIKKPCHPGSGPGGKIRCTRTCNSCNCLSSIWSTLAVVTCLDAIHKATHQIDSRSWSGWNHGPLGLLAEFTFFTLSPCSSTVSMLSEGMEGFECKGAPDHISTDMKWGVPWGEWLGGWSTPENCSTYCLHGSIILFIDTLHVLEITQAPCSGHCVP